MLKFFQHYNLSNLLRHFLQVNLMYKYKCTYINILKQYFLNLFNNKLYQIEEFKDITGKFN